MSKVIVYIEETLCRGTEIDVPDELDLDEDEEMEYALVTGIPSIVSNTVKYLPAPKYASA